MKKTATLIVGVWLALLSLVGILFSILAWIDPTMAKGSDDGDPRKITFRGLKLLFR